VTYIAVLDVRAGLSGPGARAAASPDVRAAFQQNFCAARAAVPALGFL
jgi:hypothetical protein